MIIGKPSSFCFKSGSHVAGLKLISVAEDDFELASLCLHFPRPENMVCATLPGSSRQFLFFSFLN